MDDFFQSNLDKLWTLISVILGGLVTYLSTSATENRRYKKQAKKENLEKVLILYCTCLENTKDKINEIYQSSPILYQDNNVIEWINCLRKPFKYVDVAAERAYLSKSMRNQLEEYKVLIERFDKELENEYEECHEKYTRYVKAKLKVNNSISPFTNIAISLNKKVGNKIKMAILTKMDITLLNDITSVFFIHDEDREEYTSVRLDDDTRRKWEAIRYGQRCDIEGENTEMELSFWLLDFISQNITDEKENLNKIVDKTVSGCSLKDISDKLDYMIKDTVEKIDKIVN